MIPGRKRKGWNRHTIKEAAGRHAVRRVCPLLLPWKTHLLGVFVIANTVFGVSIASVLFGTFCYRQCAFRHVLLSPVCFSAHFVIASAPFRHDLLSPVCFSARFVIASVLFGTFCYRQRTFSARFVMAGTYFRCSLSSSIWLFDVVCDFRNIISCAFCRSCGFLALLLSSS